jgi:hypothetical protein
MINKEGLPPLRGWAPGFGHVLRNRGLPDINAELEQLAHQPFATRALLALQSLALGSIFLGIGVFTSSLFSASHPNLAQLYHPPPLFSRLPVPAAYVCGIVTSTSATGWQRAIDPQTGTTTNSSLQFAHRVGAGVKITDLLILELQMPALEPAG